MDASEALTLFDSFWFEMEILKKDRSTTNSSSASLSPPDSPTMASVYMQIQKQQSSPPPPPPPESGISNLRPTRGSGQQQSTIFRSMSEDLYTKPGFNASPASPDSVLTSQLRTIMSGKEATGYELELDFTNYSPPPPPPPPRKASPTASGSNSPPKARKPTTTTTSPGGGGRTTRRAAKKGPASKSLSSLEFEELKGFMDLGFVFSEEDKDSSLISILPGLQRLGKEVEPAAAEEEADESTVPRRPYLSEAWAVQEKEKTVMKKNPPPMMMNWRVPALGGSEIDMKDSLRLWAHNVASTVR